MRRRERTQKPVAEINITPFTDVILVLLIIFMVATPLIIKTGTVNVKLPKAVNAQEGRNLKEISEAVITLTSEGPIYLGEELVNTKELRDKVARMFAANPEMAVMLQADKRLPFRNVVSVLDMLKGLGITRLNIAAVKEE